MNFLDQPHSTADRTKTLDDNKYNLRKIISKHLKRLLIQFIKLKIFLCPSDTSFLKQINENSSFGIHFHEKDHNLHQNCKIAPYLVLIQLLIVSIQI